MPAALRCRLAALKTANFLPPPCHSAFGKSVDVFTILPYNVGVSMDLVRTGAAFNVAARSLNKRFQGHLNVSVTHLYNVSHRTCDDVASMSAVLMAEYFYRHKSKDTFYAIATTGCGDSTGVASLAQGFDWPIFTIGFAKLESATSSRVISLGGSYESLAASMFKILHSFKWYHVAIVFEQKPVVSPWYEKVANAVLDNTVATSLPFVLEKYDVNARSNQSLRAMMSLAKRRNRVFLLLTTGLTALNILNMAAESGMARGNFVFINVQSFQSMQYGSPLQFSHPYNDATEQAYRSLLFLVCRSDDALLTEENEAIADNSKDVYNFTDQDNDRPLQSMQVQFCFNAMEIFAVLVNETEGASCRDKGNDGLSLAGKMANRTFHLVTGDFTIDSLQARNADLSIFGFNVTTKTMQVVGSFFWYPKGHLVWSQDLHMDWATANSQPPLDVPVCGFSGQEGECATKAMFIIISALAASVASVLIFLILALLRRWHGGNQCVPCVWLDTASLQNMTAFSSDDIVKRSYEHYSERDYLSRVSFNAKI